VLPRKLLPRIHHQPPFIGRWRWHTRINFDIELSADEYAKSVELDPASVASKRGLAEMKRALGKSDEAVALYRELLAKNESDLPSRTGLILALLDSGNRTEAETEMTASLEKAPGNMILLAGAAYWYASKGFGDKAVELAQKAVAKEPRYVWSHIALGRGYMAQGKPVEAEQALIKARTYGNFPTLEYEIASARVAAGFFREAVEDLQKQFSVTSAGDVKTNLGGRVMREEKSIADLAAFERKASIFAPQSDNPEVADTLKALLAFDEKAQATTPNEDEMLSAAQAFTKGTDKMRLHRQIYAASVLLQKKIAIPGVLELTKAAAATSDSALEVANPRSAVMASELYEPRAMAFRKGEFLLVPEVPSQTLSAILRGRIEEIAGWALYQQNNFPAAIIRLRRAKGVLPAKSAWWRSSVWRLGAALAANGDEAEALTMYIESYKTDKPDYAKFSVVEGLYKKIHGNTDGLEESLGSARVASTSPVQTVNATPMPMPGPVVPRADSTSTGTPTADLSKAFEEKPKAVVEAKTGAEPKTESPQQNIATTSEKPEQKIEPIVNDSPKIAETKVPVESKTETPAVRDPVEEKKPDAKIVEPEPKPVAPQVSEPATPDKQELKTEPAPKTEPAQPEPIVEKKEEPKIPAQTEPIVEKKEEPKAPPQTEPVVEKKEEPKTEPPPGLPDKPSSDAPDPKTVSESSNLVAETQPAKPLSGSASAKSATRKSTQKPAATIAKTDVTKPLFEPIIISIPAPKPASRSLLESSGSERARVIAGEESKSETVTPCGLTVSQESISIINDGGRVGMLVTVEAPGDSKTLSATSSSPKDIDVKIEPEISGLSDRRFFVIKSISTALGVYTVTFSAPCGKKDVVVTVR
jgi:tetratricopeptide (TPR) repeat protein